MTQVLLDTNILLIPGTLGVNIFNEIEKVCNGKPEFAVLEGTLVELDKIILEQRGKFKAAASLGRQLMKQKSVKVLRSNNKPVDDMLVELSTSGSVVATQDAALKKRLTKPYLTLKAKKYFVMVR